MTTSWDEFVGAMIEIGFTVDAPTVGSCVRFTPRGGEPPINFHRPFPDPTIHPVMLRDFVAHLRDTYGFDEEMFQTWEARHAIDARQAADSPA
ncbi:hypothetical protein EXIGLDRAFT_626337 [Exidia glandulosa HHB12029]|uniref:Type II toxin-antitoxin system HicA family toxin n=1 Tax=Exidia glandulosa HHB12029 TaxID=1314781 RepID=A0A165CRK6_EXIGL|nr:hypothetical protein EXIGLDRAFT_626337 [Exidia glandulosa HHB12029]